MFSPSPNKRQRILAHPTPPPSDLSQRRNSHSQVFSMESCNESPSPPDPPALDLVNQSNKIIWVDVGIDSKQTYWWPALVYDSGAVSYVSLIPDSKSKLIDSNPKLLSSFKATKQFQAHSDFQPTRMNPLLKDENLRSNYPSLQSLQEAYVIGREKHVIYSFQEDNDLPDLSACMVPLSQESRALLANVLSQDNQKRQTSQEISCERESELTDLYKHEENDSSEDSSIDELDQTFDQPDLELDIPGETVLSRTNSRNQHYWPARIVSYAGLRVRKRRGRYKDSIKKNHRLKKEKFYELEFFDGNMEIVPRSHFYTTDQDEFYRVEIGRVATKEVNFQDVIPQIKAQLNQLDSIISGKSSDKEIAEKHDNFFINQSSKKSQREIPQDVKYAKYGEELIHRMGQLLIQRYLPGHDESAEGSEKKIKADERFEKLTEPEQSRYVYNILVPHLIWLITVPQYMEDAEAELRTEGLLAKECQENCEEPGNTDDGINDGTMETTDRDSKILERAKKLASLVIQEVDLVDKVTGLRVRKSSYFHHADDSFPDLPTTQRRTQNSRKTSQLS